MPTASGRKSRRFPPLFLKYRRVAYFNTKYDADRAKRRFEKLGYSVKLRKDYRPITRGGKKTGKTYTWGVYTRR